MDQELAPGGPNMFDSGPDSKLINSQPSRNSVYQQQTITQRAQDAIAGQQSAGTQFVRNESNKQSDQDYRTQEFANQYKAMVLKANSMGDKMLAVDAQMRSPEGEAFRNDIMVNKALGTGQHQDLGQYASESGRYA